MQPSKQGNAWKALNSSYCLPILLGDMNATLSPQDRTSGKSYEQDKLFHNFISDTNLNPLDWHFPHRPWTFESEIAHHSQTTGNHTHSCIDDIVLPSCILKADNTNHPSSQLFCYTADKGYKHSDHTLLVSNIPTNILGVKIKKLQQPAPSHQNERVLLRPIKLSDIEKLHRALNDPTYTPHATHANILDTGRLNNMHMTALTHLSAIENT
eukprot:scaffold79860_cov16-Tisochrysis_lutea.AAC.1